MDNDDHEAIRAIIDRQFGNLNWSPTTPAKWSAFVEDFLPAALLYPAARPTNPQKPQDFVERMKGLAANELHTFKETVLGHDIRVFGNIAIAAAVCEITAKTLGLTVPPGILVAAEVIEVPRREQIKQGQPSHKSVRRVNSR